jgi:hypothetical protein
MSFDSLLFGCLRCCRVLVGALALADFEAFVSVHTSGLEPRMTWVWRKRSFLPSALVSTSLGILSVGRYFTWQIPSFFSPFTCI